MSTRRPKMIGAHVAPTVNPLRSNTLRVIARQFNAAYDKHFATGRRAHLAWGAPAGGVRII